MGISKYLIKTFKKCLLLILLSRVKLQISYLKSVGRWG